METACSLGKTSNYVKLHQFPSFFHSESNNKQYVKIFEHHIFSAGLFTNDVKSNLAQLKSSMTVIFSCLKF